MPNSNRESDSNQEPDKEGLLKELDAKIESLRSTDPEAALEVAEMAVATAREVYPTAHKNLIHCHETLAILRKKQGDIEGAEESYREALSLSNDLLPSDLPILTRLVTKMGEVYELLNQPKAALSFYEQALPLQEKVNGADMPEVLVLLNKMARLGKELEDLEVAEKYYLRALDLYEKRRGSQHPYVADMMNNLGTLYFQNEKYKPAETMHVRALAIRESNFGDNHPDVAQSVGNLAAVFHAKGEMQKAGEYYDRSLTIYEKHLGGEYDEDFITVASNFADFLRHIDKPEQADDVEAQLAEFQKSREEK